MAMFFASPDKKQQREESLHLLNSGAPTEIFIKFKDHWSQKNGCNFMVDFEGVEGVPIRCLIIKQIHPKSAIAKDGRMRAGDNIFEINNFAIDSANASYTEAVNYQRHIAHHKVRFVVVRPKLCTNDSLKGTVTRQEVFIPKVVGVPLGISLLGSRKRGIYVAAIDPTGVVGRSGKLHQGDEIIAVDKQHVTWRTAYEVQLMCNYSNSDIMRITIKRAASQKTAVIGACDSVWEAPRIPRADPTGGSVYNCLADEMNSMSVGNGRSEKQAYGKHDKTWHIDYVDFVETRDKCLQEGRLFEDPQFPASNKSLYFLPIGHVEVVWERPKELAKDPKFILVNVHKEDVVQGQLGNCWFMAAMGNLTLNDKLFYRVVHPNQSFEVGAYAGIFHFRFWRYGSYVDVVVDDRLPTYIGLSGKRELLYAHSSCGNVFWSALLEKAYAKLNGSYEALVGGWMLEALVDMTGGLSEYIPDIQKVKRSLIKRMVDAHRRGSLMGCVMFDNEAAEVRGLVNQHAFSITDIKDISHTGNPLWLVRIRNPHGGLGLEWNGRWSDSSKHWQQLSAAIRERISHQPKADGEFWMCFEDFVDNFERMEICHLGPDEFSSEADFNATWKVMNAYGEWSREKGTAGGHPTSHRPGKHYWTNPQFVFKVRPDDKELYRTTSTRPKKNMCTVVIGLMQLHRRRHLKDGWQNLTIGFNIYQIDDDFSGPLPAQKFGGYYLLHHTKLEPIVELSHMREVTSRYGLYPGTYLLVPCTADPDQEGDFMLRAFTNGIFGRELKEL